MKISVFMNNMLKEEKYMQKVNLFLTIYTFQKLTNIYFQFGGSMPNPSDMSLYERYAHQQQLNLGVLHPDLP